MSCRLFSLVHTFITTLVCSYCKMNLEDELQSLKGTVFYYPLTSVEHKIGIKQEFSVSVYLTDLSVGK